MHLAVTLLTNAVTLIALSALFIVQYKQVVAASGTGVAMSSTKHPAAGSGQSMIMQSLLTLFTVASTPYSLYRFSEALLDVSYAVAQIAQHQSQGSAAVHANAWHRRTPISRLQCTINVLFTQGSQKLSKCLHGSTIQCGQSALCIGFSGAAAPNFTDVACRPGVVRASPPVGLPPPTPAIRPCSPPCAGKEVLGPRLLLPTACLSGSLQ